MTTRADLEREKMINAIIFFTKNTQHCYSLKLFKLLFFLDFEMFRQTGQSTTGLKYFALPQGPVPTALYRELNHPAADLKNAVSVQTTEDGDFKQVNFCARQTFDDGCFTRRELKEMTHLAYIFKELKSDDMTKASHDKTSQWRAAAAAWDEIHDRQKRPNAEIPYLLALDNEKGSISEEQAEAIAADLEDAGALFR